MLDARRDLDLEAYSNSTCNGFVRSDKIPPHDAIWIRACMVVLDLRPHVSAC